MMGNFLSTTSVLNAVYDTSANALKVNITGFSGGTTGTSGTSGTSGIDGLSGATGVDGTSGTSGIDGLSGATGADGTSGTSGIDGTSGTSGVDGGGITGIADNAVLYNVSNTITGKTNFTFDNATHTITALSDTYLTTGGVNFNFGYNNTVSSYNNVVFGADNIADSYSNFIAGKTNHAVSYENAIFGQSNHAAGRDLVAGRQNNSTGGESFIGGYNHISSGGWTTLGGRGHTTRNVYDAAFGSYNTTVAGEHNNILLGQGLIGGYNSNMIAVGCANDPITGLTYENGVMFQVGCGSGSTIGHIIETRRNGFTVYRNMNAEFGGDVNIAGNLIVYDVVDGTAFKIQVSGGTIVATAV